MGPLNIVLLVIMAISAIFTIILVLMHSGKGTGVSDMIAASIILQEYMENHREEMTRLLRENTWRAEE